MNAAASNWTDPALESALASADAIEVAGCRDDGESTVRVFGEQWTGERIDDSEGATFWSVYVHRDGEGADCVADRATQSEARELGAALAARRSIPLHDFS